MLAEELKRKEELLALAKRRKHELDKQAVLFGASSDPAINIQREDLTREIAVLERDVESLRQKFSSSGNVTTLENVEQNVGDAVSVADEVHDKKSDGSGRSNLISAAVCLIIAIILCVWPQSLGGPTIGIAGVFGLFGFVALGMGLDQRTRKDGFSDIFSGIGFLLVPATIYYYVGLTIWTILPLTILALLAVVGINSGMKKRIRKSSS